MCVCVFFSFYFACCASDLSTLKVADADEIVPLRVERCWKAKALHQMSTCTGRKTDAFGVSRDAAGGFRQAIALSVSRVFMIPESGEGY